MPGALFNRIRYQLANRVRKADGKLKVGVEVDFLGRSFTITSEKEQILDLLLSTCEDIVRTNRDLRAGETELCAVKEEVERRNALVQAQAELERAACVSGCRAGPGQRVFTSGDRRARASPGRPQSRAGVSQGRPGERPGCDTCL